MDDVFLSFDVPLGRFKMFGVRLKSKSKKRNFATLGSAGTADSRVVMFCEDIPSERSSTDSGWGSRSSAAPSNVPRKERESVTRPIQPTTTFSTQKIHHMRAPFSGHNVGHSTLCIRDQYGPLQYSITAGGWGSPLAAKVWHAATSFKTSYRVIGNSNSLNLNLIYSIVSYCTLSRGVLI